MHFTTQSKKSAGALTLNQIIFAFALLVVVFVGQTSALPHSGDKDSDFVESSK